MSRRKKPTAVESIAATGDVGEPAGAVLDENGAVLERQLAAESDADVRANETKSEKFVRLANRRVVNAIKAISYVANLSNRATYDYTPEQAHKIMMALDEAVAACAIAFTAKDGQPKGWSL